MESRGRRKGKEEKRRRDTYLIRAIDVSYSEGWSEQAETTRSKRAGDGMEGREGEDEEARWKERWKDEIGSVWRERERMGEGTEGPWSERGP